MPMNRLFLRFVMLHPPHIFPTPLVGVLQYFKDVRFLVECLALYKIVRDNAKCAVFLQCPPADPQNLRKFLVRQKTFAMEYGPGDIFHSRD